MTAGVSSVVNKFRPLSTLKTNKVRNTVVGNQCFCRLSPWRGNTEIVTQPENYEEVQDGGRTVGAE